jgi:DNA-binding NarL/FixJ family response regulator
MTTKKIKILIADDHNLVRSGIVNLIENVPGFYIVGEAENGHDLVSKYFKIKPDLIITDISMPVLSGTGAVAIIKERDPSAKVLFLSMYSEEEYVYKVLKCKGDGLVNKNITKGELILAIETIYKGKQYFGADYNEEKLRSIAGKYFLAEKRNDFPEIHFTDREFEVLKCICDGLSSMEIAEKLFLSKRTIDTYRSNLIRKFNVTSSTQLIKEAIAKRII